MKKIVEELRMAKEIVSRQTVQQATRIRKENSITTKEFLVVKEIAKDLKKSCRDREISVAIELTG